MAKGATSKSKTKNEENRKREEEQQRQQANQKRAESKPQRTQTAENKPTTQEAAPKPTSTQIPTLEPKYASAKQIEEARDFGRRSLEMAQSGQLKDEAPFSYGVRGIAEQYDIPKLEEAPSTTMPSNEYAPQTHQERTGKGYRPSPEEVPTYNKNAYKSEQRGAQSSEGPVDILGTRRPNSISEEGQRQVDKLNRRIESLRSIPMTGDAAIDEVTQRNNQDEIARLQRQIDSIYDTDNSSNESNVERYLDPNYRLSKYEEQNAEQIFDEYLENNPKAKELYNTNDAAMSSLLAQRFTPEEAEEYARMVTLKNKTSNLSSAGLHMAQSMPFVKGLADKSTEAYGELKDTDLSDYNYSSQLEQTQRQNPLASTAGNMGYQLGSYAAFAPLVEGIPVVGKAASALGGKFSNPAVTKAVESIVSGQAADTLLDTLPNEIIPDVMEGNWRDLPKDILLNQAGNLAFNVAGEGIGALARNFIPSLRQADEVADAVKQNELDPADLAKQNEIDVNAKVDNVNQAVDEVENLAKQADEVTPKVDEVAPEVKTEAPVVQSEKVETPKLNNEEQRLFSELSSGYNGTREWWQKTIDRAQAYINEGGDPNVANNALAELERLERESKELIDLGGTPTWSMPRPSQQLDGVAARINQTLDNVSFEDEIIAREANAIRKAIDNYRTALEGDSLDAINQARRDLYNACKRFDGRAKKISLEGYDGSFGKKSFSYNTPQSMGVGSPQKLWQNIADAEENNRRLLSGIEPEDTITKLLNGETLEETTKAVPEVKAESPVMPDLPEVEKQILDDVPQVEKGNGQRRVSKYRTNSMEKLDSVDEITAPMSDYEYNTYSVTQQTADGLARWGNNPNAIRDLQSKANWDEVDARYAQRKWTELMESGTAQDIEEAQRLSRKMSYELREGGRLVQTAAEMDDIAGQLNQAKQMVNQRVDKTYGIGTSEALDNFATKVDIALGDVDMSTKEGREKAAEVMAEMMSRNLRSYAPTNKNMSSKTFQGTDHILRDIRSGKIDSVDKLVERIYKQNGGAYISAADQKKIYDLLESASTFEEGSREREKSLARAARIALKGVPSSFGEKIKSILYTNMLGNFKTAVSRNAAGNLGYQVLEQARSPIAGLVDRATSLVTKQHSSQGWNLGKAGAYARGLKKGVVEQASDIANGINTGRSGALGWAEALKNNKTTWNEASKTKVGRGLAKLANSAEFYVTSAMKMGDRPFFEANYAQRNIELRQLIKKYGKENVAGLSGVPDELLDDTIDMMSAVHAADSVFQRRGKMAEGLTDVRNGLAKMSEGAVGVDLLSTSATPFTMTPGNILEKGIEYSPLGLIKNAVETAREVKGGNFNQKRFVDELSRTITGIPVLYGAYKLAENGNISEGYSEDPDERAAQQADDYIEYGLKIGDKTYDTSDIPVFGQFMQAAGAISENGLSPESLGQALEAITMGSAMQGIRKAFGGDLQYSTSGSMLDNLVNTVKSAGTQLVPSLVRQTAQTTDEYKRDLGEYGTNQYYLNNIINSIPKLRETLPIKYDNEGNPVLQNQGRPIGNRILENYVLPMKVSEYSPSELTQEATRLADSTDNSAGFVPRAARKDLRQWAEDTEGLDYSEEMFYDYKKRLGDLNSDTAESIIHSDFYNNLDDFDKVSVLADIYSAMKQVAKNEVTGLETDDKLANRYMESEDPVQGLLSRLEAKYNSYGIDADKYEEMRDQGVDFTPWEGYKEAQEEYDIEDNAAYREAYANGGYEGLGQEVQYQSALDENGLNDSKTVRQAWDAALHAGADPDATLAKISQQRSDAIDLGFTKSDGTVNTAAYQKAATVLGDDDASLSQFASLQTQLKESGLTKQTDYVPYVMGQNYSDTQKGQYMMLLAGDTPNNISGKGASSAYDEYGYDGYYYYRVLQNAVKDYNGDDKVNKYDRIQKLYEDGYSQGTDYFDFFSKLSY